MQTLLFVRSENQSPIRDGARIEEMKTESRKVGLRDMERIIRFPTSSRNRVAVIGCVLVPRIWRGKNAGKAVRFSWRDFRVGLKLN